MAKSHWNPEHSDYLDKLNGVDHPTTSNPNDVTMAPKHSALSDGVNSLFDVTGYDLSERTGPDNNDFYRNYAKYMPGYEIDGIPSGAWAQNAATNHVGQGEGEFSPWTRVRDSLVRRESQMIQDKQAAGESGQLGFWDLYGAHQDAYATSGGGGNQFIDPLSFAGAVYGSPLLEAVGINAGPFNGAAIKALNDPTDTATEGWAKRMGLAAGEMGAGALAMTNPLTAPLGMAMMGAGAFGALWNTGSAVFQGGMLNEWGGAISDTAGAAWDGAKSLGGDIVDGVGGALSSGASEIGSFLGF